MKHVFQATLIAAAFLGLSACGGAGSEASAELEGLPDAEPVAAAQTTKAEGPPALQPGDPAVGSKIPEPGTETAEADAPVYVNGYLEIVWEDLLPEGELERLEQMYQEQMILLYSSGPVAEGSAADIATQFGTFNAVPELDGKKVRLPGYTVPFEYGRDAEITEFLLVPYFGACIHAPPPPPNQTILVRSETPIKLRDLAQAVWISGELKIEIAETALADTAYVIELQDIKPYEY